MCLAGDMTRAQSMKRQLNGGGNNRRKKIRLKIKTLRGNVQLDERGKAKARYCYYDNPAVPGSKS